DARRGSGGFPAHSGARLSGRDHVGLVVPAGGRENAGGADASGGGAGAPRRVAVVARARRVPGQRRATRTARGRGAARGVVSPQRPLENRGGVSLYLPHQRGKKIDSDTLTTLLS